LSLETAIYSILSGDTAVAALVGTRIFPVVLEQGSTFPSLAYTRIDTPTEKTFADSHGLPHPRIQVECYAEGPADCHALADAATDAMAGYRGTLGDVTIQGVLVLDAGRDTWQDNPPLYRRDIDFEIWYEE
jgi:hypothetical protein